MDNLNYTEMQLLMQEKLNDGIFIADKSTHQILYANQQIYKMFGRNPIGEKCYRVCANRDCQCSYCLEMCEADKLYSWELVRGGESPVMYLVSGILHGDCIICRMINVSEYMLLVGDVISYTELLCRQVEEREMVDRLTGLGNRNAFIKKGVLVYNALEAVGVMSFDINNMKAANDNFGHEAGDELIRTAAAIIDSIKTAEMDTYRMGGDEFALVVPDATEEIMADLMAEWQKASLGKTTDSGIVCSIAAGCVLKQDEESFDSVLRRADREMYLQKHKMK